jgi:hypothetical protein
MKSVSEEKFRLTPTESQFNGGAIGEHLFIYTDSINVTDIDVNGLAR